ncbi:MAG: hypothetical protein ABFC75_03850 [Rectinema sp.]
MIQWNAALVRRLSCPEDRKAALPHIVRTLTGYSQKARTEGLASLAESARMEEDPFLALGLELMAEGLADETLEDILSAYLVTSDLRGFDFLRACMVAEALVSISLGDSPALTLRKLAAYCGAEQAVGLLSEFGTASPHPAEHS